MSIRSLNLDDVPQLRVLENLAHQELAEMVASVLLREENHFTGLRSAHVNQLAVRPDYKRLSLGTRLMDHCENLNQTFEASECPN